MEYTVIISNQFKKDFRRCIRRGLDMIRLVIAPPQFPPQPPRETLSAEAAAAQPWRNPFCGSKAMEGRQDMIANIR